jgi:hypothetical protein
MTPINNTDKTPIISSSVSSTTEQSSAGSLLGKVVVGVALVAALGGLWFQSSQVDSVRKELAQTHEQMSKMRTEVESSVSAMKEQSQVKMDETQARLAADFAAAKKDAQNQAARAAATARQQTGKAVKELAEKNEQLMTELNAIKEANESKATQIDETLNGIKGDVGGVRTEVAATRTELEKTTNELRRMNGDMGVMSGLIATNSTELDALRKLGERDYYEFTLAKSSPAQKIAGIQVALKKADVKRSRFTLDVVADDHKVEKKDKGLNEPVQFYTSHAKAPYEIVVNRIVKDKVIGYISVPKMKIASR